MTKRKAIRFSITYDDGTEEYIEGNDANEHLENVNGACVYAAVHSYVIPLSPGWKKRLVNDGSKAVDELTKMAQVDGFYDVDFPVSKR